MDNPIQVASRKITKDWKIQDVAAAAAGEKDREEMQAFEIIVYIIVYFNLCKRKNRTGAGNGNAYLTQNNAKKGKIVKLRCEERNELFKWMLKKNLCVFYSFESRKKGKQLIVREEKTELIQKKKRKRKKTNWWMVDWAHGIGGLGWRENKRLIK